MVCHGNCAVMDTKSFTGSRIMLWFSLGYRGCRECNLLIKMDGIYCPCCGMRTTITPRRSKRKMEVLVRH